MSNHMRSHNPGQQKKKTTKKRKADNNAANDEEVHHPKAAPSLLAKKKRRVTTTAKQAARNDAKDEKAISKASVTFGDEQHRQGSEEPMAKKKRGRAVQGRTRRLPELLPPRRRSTRRRRTIRATSLPRLPSLSVCLRNRLPVVALWIFPLADCPFPRVCMP